METKDKIIEEVKLAEEGTIMAEFQKERTDAISEMFDNKYDNGIYPTSKFFIRLDKAVEQALARQKAELETKHSLEVVATQANCDQKITVLKADFKEAFKRVVEGEFSKHKIPCSCPKGGMFEKENGDTYFCDRCGGSQWVLPEKLNQVLTNILKSLED